MAALLSSLRPRRTRPRRRRAPVVIGLVALGMVVVGSLAAAAVVVAGPEGTSSVTSRRGDASVDAPVAGTSAASEAAVTQARPALRRGAVRPEVPRAVRLPGGAVVPVRAVSTRRDGLLDVPPDVRTAGWWRGGSRLGDPLGATLLAAHVDSTTQGLGPFAALLGVRPGQRFAVTSATLRQRFEVVSLRVVAQGDLRAKSWIHGAGGRRRLVLVTCAPPYDRARGGYQNLAVVTAVPLGPPMKEQP